MCKTKDIEIYFSHQHFLYAQKNKSFMITKRDLIIRILIFTEFLPIFLQTFYHYEK